MWLGTLAPEWLGPVVTRAADLFHSFLWALRGSLLWVVEGKETDKDEQAGQVGVGR